MIAWKGRTGKTHTDYKQQRQKQVKQQPKRSPRQKSTRRNSDHSLINYTKDLRKRIRTQILHQGRTDEYRCSVLEERSDHITAGERSQEAQLHRIHSQSMQRYMKSILSQELESPLHLYTHRRCRTPKIIHFVHIIVSNFREFRLPMSNVHVS